MHNIPVSLSDSPPRAPPIQYDAPLGTRWAKEMAAAGGAAAFDLPTDPKAIGPWILGECVGKGASGRVKIAKHRRTGQLAAVKILPIAPLVNSRVSLVSQQAKSDKQRLGIDREITMMKLMNHPNIMRIYDVYEGDKELFLVLEYVEGGELFDFLVNRGKLPAHEALIYFRQIVYGLNYAHTFSIIHRDLKPENILIASLSPPLIKIADWGMAAFAPPSLQLETSCGSPHYASPEIVNGEKYQGNATDIWSCGVILYALLTGRLPFDDKNVRNLLSKVKNGKYEIPSWVDPLAKDLLSKMLVVDVKQRITIPQILSHPWLISQPSIQFSAHDGNTYALLPPPLPPSPGILARPINSPDLIDPELLASLRIIWGRHADSNGDSIRRDLCSPAGHGVHAKAFYFLLGKYRDTATKNRNEDPESDSKDLFAGAGLEIAELSGLGGAPTFVTRKYEVPQNHPVFSHHQTLSPDGTTSSPSVHLTGIFTGQSAIATGRKRTITDGSISTRKERSELPLSARPISHHSNPKAQTEMSKLPVLVSQKNDDATSSSVRPKSALSGVGRSGGTRVVQPRRGYTYSILSEKKSGDSATGAQAGTTIEVSQRLQNSKATGTGTSSSNRPRSSIGFFPPVGEANKGGPGRVAITAVRQSLGSPRSLTNSPTTFGTIGAALPSLEVPLVTSAQVDAVLQRSTDELKPNDTEKKNNKGGKVSTVVHVPPHGHRRVRVRDDKENHAIEEDWNHVNNDAVDHGTGVGLGVLNRDVGKDLRNVVPATVSSAKAKDKKGRPPPLELPSLNPKRSTLALLGSPIALSSPIHLSSATNKASASPVVGEFKGWFSNLFNWKNNSSSNVAIIYSPEDVQGTRSKVSRILEEAGVVISNSQVPTDHQPRVEQSDALFCRVDHPGVDATTGFPLKTVRFRVEFRTSTTAAEPRSGMRSIIEENVDFATSFKQVSNISVATSPVTPAPTNGLARPRTSFLLGGRSSAHVTPLPSPALVSGFAKGEPNLPPGYLCAMALIYEKGSITTFKHVWKKLKEEYGDLGNGAYPCLSPAVPNTPYIETHKV